MLFTLSDKEFGDAYHVAAAIVLWPREEIEVVVAPGRKAELMYHFLNQIVGSGARLRGDRPAVRLANGLRKATTLLGEWARREGPDATQRGAKAISDRFLGCATERDRAAVEAYLSARPDLQAPGPKALVWIRNSPDYCIWRNSTSASTQQLCDALRSAGLQPVLIGQSPTDEHDAVRQLPSLVEFFENPTFSEPPEASIARQLWLFYTLSQTYQVVAQVGMASGGMDGAALLSIPTVEFAAGGNAERMGHFEALLGRSFKVVRLQGRAKGARIETLSDGEMGEMLSFLQFCGAVRR